MSATTPMQRIVVVAVSGAGKSTLAAELARRLNYPFVELDGLYWLPEWTPRANDAFRTLVSEAISGETWVVGGNYSVARDVIWGRADTIIWLDYPLWLCLWRVTKRSFLRALTHEKLWGTGNYETWRGFFSKDSMMGWVLKTYHRRRKEYSTIFDQPEYAHLTVLRHGSPRETRRWLNEIGKS